MKFNDASCQTNYYWSDGKKINFKVDSTNLIVKLKESASIESFSTSVKTEKIENIEKLEKSGELLLVNIKGKVAKDFYENFKAIPSLEKVMFAYTFEGIPFFPTGEILIQTKKNVTINEVIALVNKKVSLVKTKNHNRYVLNVKDWNDIFSVSNIIYQSGLVEYCEPNMITEIIKLQADPLYDEQYYLNNTGQFSGTPGIDINAPEAWDITTGMADIRVAVIDDGVENHEDINGRVLQGFTPSDPTGFGAPVAQLPPANLTTIGHGQSCAGIIAASHNALGIRGIIPSADIVPVNIFEDWYIYTNPSTGVQSVRYRESYQDIADAIDFAWNNADVLSNSWAYGTDTQLSSDIVQAIGRAITQGRNNLGCPVIFAAGNSGNNVRFPSNVNGVITVGAIDNDGDIWSYSCTGNSMDFVAPSGNTEGTGDVRTTDRTGALGYVAGNYYDNFGGTSAACPQVAGIAALMLSVNPLITESQVHTFLRNSATDIGASGWDATHGYGLPDAEEALHQVGNTYTISGANPICSGNTSYSLNYIPPGASILWTSSNNISIISGSTTNNCVMRGVANSNTAGWVRVRLRDNDDVFINRTIWVEKPSFYLDGDDELPAGSAGIALVEYAGDDSPYTQGVYDVDWSSTGGLSNLRGDLTKCQYIALIGGPAYIYADATNACGSIEERKAVDVTGGFFMLMPNPSDDYVEITTQSSIEGVNLNSTETNEPFETGTIRIFDSFGMLHSTVQMESKNQRISTSHLKDGVYVVEIKTKLRSERLNLVIKH